MFDDRLGTVSFYLLLPVTYGNHTSLMLIISKAARVHAFIILLEGSMARRHYVKHQRGCDSSHSRCQIPLWDRSCPSDWNNVPSRTVARQRASGIAGRLRLVSSCQKLQDDAVPRLILAADTLLLLLGYPWLYRRTCKQRLQRGLRAGVPTRPSTRRFKSKFRAGVEIGLPVAFILGHP